MIAATGKSPDVTTWIAALAPERLARQHGLAQRHRLDHERDREAVGED